MMNRRTVNRVSPIRRPGNRRPRVAGDSGLIRSSRRAAAGVQAPARPRPAGSRPHRGSSRPLPRGEHNAARRRLRLPRRTRTAGRARRWSRPLAAFLTALLLTGFAVLAAQHPGVADDNAAFVDSAATEEVRAAAEHTLRTIYGYKVEDIDGYEAAVREVVTGKMREELDTFAATTVSAIEQAQTSADAAADPIGVTLLTEDRAEVLVNLVVSATKDGVAQQSAAGPVVLQMQKVDGRWLAADIIDR